MIRTPTRLAFLLALTLTLADCDKCGDYFWIDTATLHSCKDVPAAH